MGEWQETTSRTENPKTLSPSPASLFACTRAHTCPIWTLFLSLPLRAPRHPRLTLWPMDAARALNKSTLEFQELYPAMVLLYLLSQLDSY